MAGYRRGGSAGGQRLENSYRRGFGSGVHGRKGGDGAPPANEGPPQPPPGPARKDVDAEDEMMAFTLLEPGLDDRLGWLVNMVPGTAQETNRASGDSASAARNVQVVDCFFIAGDGKADFRATVVSMPYMYVAPRDQNATAELDTAIRRLHLTRVHDIVHVELEDMDQPNHLALPIDQARKTFLKVICKTASDLAEVRRSLAQYVRVSQEDAQRANVAMGDTNISATQVAAPASVAGIAQAAQIREHDVAPVNRMAIDSGIRVGFWYNVNCEVASGSSTPEVPAGMASAELTKVPDIVTRANPVVLAYDIECTKQPLKFPDAKSSDQVMMISYMVDGQGFLIVNREVVAEDIVDFSYTPKPEFPGDFQVFNEANEKETLSRFFEEVRMAQPRVIVTYNGDMFDFPFVEKRAEINGLDMGLEIGMRCDETSGECRGRSIVHMDCFHWVNRDSYLPQGSRGLKAVTRALLGYDPLELDPEEMTPAATDQPQLLASYSVSDAVCTYYLYLKYVHPFTFSLCNIIPLNPDDILRKGSGTLCEMLLMSEARARKIVCPNKHRSGAAKNFNGHLLESETYIGGHVEALQSGVFRSDIPMKFKVDGTAIDELCDDLDKTLKFAIEEEAKRPIEDATNLAEIRKEIYDQLHSFKENPTRSENPLIYHLDVAAMYPNIILTNRLQPHAVATTQDCAACDFNEVSNCKKFMPWTWRGEHYPSTRGEVEMIRATILAEGTTPEERDQLMRKRLKEYSRKTYRRGLDTVVQEKTATICQRENPFYVDTVRAFRDRRYEYKGLLKTWKKKLAIAEKEGDLASIEEAKACVVMYDSLQLAHKCILNSFYGYVMRKGARWYSMEMAGVVTQTGAAIIRGAKEFIDRVGVSLELDTDGIWCTLPKTFPENFTIKFTDGKQHSINFICSVFNRQVAQNFSNEHYHVLRNRETLEYKETSECSIFFELDGPYKAMILPASKEEGKSIKKRYAVFNEDGSIAELKGFELKRRGELKLIKVFQQRLFHKFLDGTTLTSCYDEVATVANQWLDVLDQRGEMLEDSELLELLVEQNNMSRPLADYIANKQKSAAITTAKRLSELLGPQMVRDKGLACKYVIANKPEGLQVTERAIPVQIFSMEKKTQMRFLKSWLRESQESELELRNLIDWDYYFGRLGSAILKIITIPAALQLVDNPVPRVPFPDWLVKRIRELKDPRKQTSISRFFSVMTAEEAAEQQQGHPLKAGGAGAVLPQVRDIEEIGGSSSTPASELAVKPKPEANYKGWLNFKKKEWIARYKSARKSRQAASKQRRRKFDHLDRSQATGSGLVETDVIQPATRRRRAIGFSERPDAETGVNSWTDVLDVNLENAVSWHIISISKTLQPGHYRMWVVPQHRSGQVGDMVRVPLRINRRLYLNSRFREEGATEIARVLPRNRARLSLYEVDVSEEEFLRPSRGLASQLHSSSNDGVYGGQVPLEFRAILDLGCVCAPKSRIQSQQKVLTYGLMLDDLVIRSDQDGEYGPSAYLTHENAIFQTYLYSCKATDGSDRVSYGLVSKSTKRALLIFCSSRQSANPINGSAIWRDVLETSGNEAGLPPEMNVRVEYVTEEVEAHKLLSIELGRLAQAPRVGKKTVILTQSHKKVEYLIEHVRGLRFFPAVEISPYALDGEFPPLAWERKSARTCFHRFVDSSTLLLEQIETARFAGIPIGNINCKNPYGQALDAIFGRELMAKNHVLWASTGPQPDLGGSEQDDNLFGELSGVSDAPEVSSPGIYRTFCAELGMQDLPIATILGSTSISEMEGTDLTADISAFGEVESKGKDRPAPLDDLVGVAPAFAVLKSLVTRWHQISSRAGPLARSAGLALLELHRWVQSESALLYDAALHKLLHGLIRKTFWQLMAEFKRLGATIVHATTSRIILAAPRVTVPEGVQYTRFIIHTLKEKALFGPIELANFRGLYCSIAFLDPHNFAGIPVQNEVELIEGTFALENSSGNRRSFGIEGDQLPDLRASWDLATEFPEEAQVCWVELVHKFLLEPLLLRLKDVASNSVNDTDPPVQSAIRGDSLGPECSRVVQKIQNRLFKRVQDLRERGVDENSILRLVVALCHVWSLDSSTSEDVMSLRRSILKFLGVREFSSEAAFKKHSHAVIVRGVMCDFCSDVSDMDLARSGITETEQWSCEVCETSYDPTKLEMMLVRDLQRKLAAFQLQDLVCTKCSLVKRENMAMYCSCAGGQFKLQIEAKAWHQELDTIAKLARQHRLKYLQSIVQWCQQT